MGVYLDLDEKSVILHTYNKKGLGKKLNRIKVVLADRGLTNKWLAETIHRDPATISKWVTNATQPPLETLIEIALALNVGIEELVRMPEVQ